MGSLIRAMFALLIGLAAAGSVAAVADPDDSASPIAADPATGAPRWERPKLTRFSAMRCGAGEAIVGDLVINRSDSSQTGGPATYDMAGTDVGFGMGVGGWTLTGADLTVTGDGFVLRGRWVGAFLTATIVRAGHPHPVRCRFQVAALRRFTEYQ
jgi:hypothetical protein